MGTHNPLHAMMLPIVYTTKVLISWKNRDAGEIMPQIF
jgi:hypothetical protein